MQDAPVGSQDAPTAGYSLQEAAALLGIGVNTLRRRITAGQVRGERVRRPQGYVWRVYLDGRHPPSQPTNHPTDQEAPRSLPHPPAPLAQAEALASLIQATLTPIVGPLVEQIERKDELIREQDATIREQAVAITWLLATLPAPEAAQATTAGRETASGPVVTAGAPLPRWRRWWVLSVAALVMAIVLAGALLAMPQ
jgi:hypothetical protein